MTHDQKIARKLADHIEKHLDQPLEITQLAEQYHLSKRTLGRIFKQTFKETIHHYIRKKRLEKSYRFITLSNAPIKSIVSRVGFKSITAFTTSFQSYFNTTPGSLRKNGPPRDKNFPFEQKKSLLNKKSRF